MHRIASLPGEDSSENLALVEQPSAPVLLLTSARTDISTLAKVLNKEQNEHWGNRLRALPLEYLTHKAQIDHYVSTTALYAKIIIVRILGGKGHWSYGLEKLKQWSREDSTRKLIVLSGTKDHEIELNGISNIPLKLSLILGRLIRIGGLMNLEEFLRVIEQILLDKSISTSTINITQVDDPQIWDWKEEKGNRVGIILYTSYLQAGNVELIERLNKELRNNGLVPRALWVSSLKDKEIQKKVLELFQVEKVNCVISTTSFATVNSEEIYSEGLIWDELNKPIFQLLISNRNKKQWLSSHRGLTPIDFSLQIVLPELDGRITTRIGAFREKLTKNDSLSITIENYKVSDFGIKWIVKHIKSWLCLSEKENSEKKISLILANYPIKDGRIANGVGLDTPQSLVKVLSWLKEDGYYLGEKVIPDNGKELMKLILSKRTNSPESFNRKPLDYLTLDEYMNEWNFNDNITKLKIVKKWGEPNNNLQLEEKGYPIHGIRFGNVCILIQQSRGYEQDNLKDIHSPDLPPNHNYLAQYIWIDKVFNSDCIIHFGKHGTVEWLPGKSVGLSKECFPEVALPNIPHLYPFIVNDPGEGSQAKRRTQAVIIDHLTPPIGMAKLYGDLILIETLIDEYQEAILVSSNRIEEIRNKLISLIKSNNLSNSKLFDKLNKSPTIEFESLLENIETYLCELKESQIRTGLHIFGKDLEYSKLCEMSLCISLAPRLFHKGLSQSLSEYIGLEFDPWSDKEGELLLKNDIESLSNYSIKKPRIIGDGTTIINDISLKIIELLVSRINGQEDSNKKRSRHTKQTYIANKFIDDSENSEIVQYISDKIIKKLKISPNKEKEALLSCLKGHRIKSGPSGAPSRGKAEVLPTGRNFYSVDLRGLPTESAWDLGKRSAQKIIDLYRLENGENLSNLAMSVWATSTMRNGGEEIAQMFSLMGVKPIWDSSTRRVIGVEAIPYSVLERPRVDVTLRISGLFRDAFPNLINLVCEAQKVIASLDESSEINPLAKIVKEGGSHERVFGCAPETYGAGLQELINLGNWNNKNDLADTYLEWSKYIYKDSETQKPSKIELENCLKRVQVVLHSQDNREHDILDSDDYYQFHGGLASAVERVTKSKTNIYFSDNANFSKPKVHRIEKEIDKVVRTRLLNPKWINGIMSHGYKGAFEMSASLDYLFAYDATSECVPDWCYKGIYKHWLINEKVSEFLSKENPWVLRDMAERLLESHNRKLWKSASDEDLDNLKRIINQSEKIIELERYQS
ncbi:cobaltochelatase subunit CobN [Prochlorococcus marinus]|uniref:cobaltochelatase subunit CobN n=1 Tax=Prochlorococcus marinus TaxID=1219 RepID=UPI0022B580AB|nr:cobaltochelatase subunit CobN [Prochlorococcus marinus]